MIVQKMKCPHGCENTTFLESVKSVNTSNDNLLLDSQKSNMSSQKVKVYTCSCCHNSFEIKENSNSGRMVL